MEEPYIRKKNDKWIIEKKVQGKTVYLMTLPPVEVLLQILASEKASFSLRKNRKKEIKKAPESSQRCAQSSLNESQKQDAKKEKKDVLQDLMISDEQAKMLLELAEENE